MKATTRIAAALGMVLMAGLALARPAEAQSAPADPAAMEQDFVRRINETRARNGAAPLAVRGDLTDIARRWSARMAADGQLSHNPNLRNEAPPKWRKLGENVGQGYSVETLHTAFENSAGHHRNMVDPAFNTVGVGVVLDGETVWVTEVFAAYDNAAAPQAAPPPPAPAPAPAPAPPPPTTAAPAPAPVTRTAPATTPPAPAPVAPPTTAVAAPPAPPVEVAAAAVPATPAPDTTTPAAVEPTAEVAAPAVPGPPAAATAASAGDVPPVLVGVAVAVLAAAELSAHAVARRRRQPVATPRS